MPSPFLAHHVTLLQFMLTTRIQRFLNKLAEMKLPSGPKPSTAQELASAAAPPLEEFTPLPARSAPAPALTPSLVPAPELIPSKVHSSPATSFGGFQSEGAHQTQASAVEIVELDDDPMEDGGRKLASEGRAVSESNQSNPPLPSMLGLSKQADVEHGGTSAGAVVFVNTEEKTGASTVSDTSPSTSADTCVGAEAGAAGGGGQAAAEAIHNNSSEGAMQEGGVGPDQDADLIRQPPMSLEWLRSVPDQEALEFLLSVAGLGRKSAGWVGFKLCTNQLSWLCALLNAHQMDQQCKP